MCEGLELEYESEALDAIDAAADEFREHLDKLAVWVAKHYGRNVITTADVVEAQQVMVECKYPPTKHDESSI